MNTNIIAAFCGTGKSYLFNNYPDKFKEIECWEYRSGNFPENYVNEVIKEIGSYEYLCISTDPVILKELNKRGIKMKLYYPLKSLRNEYLDRYLDRNSPPDFIGNIMVFWETWIEELESINFCDQVQMNSGEYLQNVL